MRPTTLVGGTALTFSILVIGCGGDGPEAPARAGTGISAADLVWTWVDFPDAKCRDGAPTGLLVNFNAASDKLMIFLEGGGACFNAQTCAVNPAHADSSNTPPPQQGVFNRNDPSNPVAGWNFIYIPYCSGDVFGGNLTNVVVPDVQGVQQFVGWTNLGIFLDRIVPTFSKASQVLLTGRSAGGFGTALNAARVAKAFGTIPVVALDDSAPPMSSTYVASCLQKRWRELWGFDQTVLAECGSDCSNPDDFMVDIVRHNIRLYPDRPNGLIAATEDGSISWFYGFGLDDCAPMQQAAALPPNVFRAGVEEFRTLIQASSQAFGTFYIDSANHTWLGGDETYATSVGGVNLKTWLSDLLQGHCSHVGP